MELYPKTGYESTPGVFCFNSHYYTATLNQKAFPPNKAAGMLRSHFLKKYEFCVRTGSGRRRNWLMHYLSRNQQYRNGRLIKTHRPFRKSNGWLRFSISPSHPLLTMPLTYQNSTSLKASRLRISGRATLCLIPHRTGSTMPV